jgi:haloalkane dehalogenase
MTRGQLPETFPKHLFPFDPNYIELDGCRVHYVDEGDGPVILFLHGNPTWSFLYRRMIQRLKHKFRCIALDYPGFGLSQARSDYDFKPASHAKIVEQFIERLKLKDITLMVQDWGGPIGLSVAVKQPQLFKSFVIGNSWAWPVNGDLHFEVFSKMLGGPLGRFLIRHFNVFVNMLIPAGTPKSKPSKQILDAYRMPFLTKDSRRATAVLPKQIIASSEFLATLEKDLSHLAAHPVLILWGECDKAFRKKERERFEHIFPVHKTVVLDGSGHYIQEEAPEQVSGEIEKWVLKQ